MSVSRLDKNGDWTFGKSLANYVTGNDEILQNVSTRLKSFKNDWFLDTEANIDWFKILGHKNNIQAITDEVVRVTSQTKGVARVTDVDFNMVSRKIYIEVFLDTIYQKNVSVGVNI